MKFITKKSRRFIFLRKKRRWKIDTKITGVSEVLFSKKKFRFLWKNHGSFSFYRKLKKSNLSGNFDKNLNFRDNQIYLEKRWEF